MMLRVPLCSALLAALLATASSARADEPAPAQNVALAAPAAPVGDAAAVPAAEPAAGEQAMPPVAWVLGPSTGDMGLSDIKIPAGYRFAPAADTKKLMELTGNPVNGGEVGFVAPDDDDWFVVFEYDETGYVKDDDKDLDANKLLAEIQEGNEAANEARRAKGWGELTIAGWEIPPRYDAKTHNLEWAVRGESTNGPVINFMTKLLGRRGVTSVSLVVGGDQKIDALMPRFRELLAGFAYEGGETYGEYRQGDKLAEYGLAALVAGGAVAVAAKSGLFGILLKGGGKLIALIAVAAAAFGRKIVGLWKKP